MMLQQLHLPISLPLPRGLGRLADPTSESSLLRGKIKAETFDIKAKLIGWVDDA